LHRRVHAPGLCLAHLPRHRLQRLLVLSPVCLSHAPAPPDPYTLSLHDALPISTRQTSWPGEDPAAPVEDLPITDRDEDFVRFVRSEEHTSELQSRFDLVCRLLLEKKKISDAGESCAVLRAETQGALSGLAWRVR